MSLLCQILVAFQSNQKTGLLRTVEQYFDRFLPKQIGKRHGSRLQGGLYHFLVEGTPEGGWTVDLNGASPSVVRGLHSRATRFIRIQKSDMERMLRDPKIRLVAYMKGPIDLSILLPISPPAVVAPQTLAIFISLALMGTFIKVDHMENKPRSPSGAWSFVQFNDLLHQQGLQDRDLDVPIQERGIGDAGQWISLATGGWYVVDRIRFLVNNLHTTLGFDTITVSLEPRTIVIEIAFTSNSPTLQGEGNAYLAPLLGIPVGWCDAAFPDVDISGFHIQLRLAPFIQSNGGLALPDLEIRFDSIFPSGPIIKYVEQSIRDGIVAAFQRQLQHAFCEGCFGWRSDGSTRSWRTLRA